MPEESLLRMDKIWRIHGDDQAWMLTAHPSQFGDFFLSMSVFHNFYHFRRGDGEIRMLVATRAHESIARMFEHMFTSIHFVPDLADIPAYDMQEWAMSRRRARFGPGGLLWIHPFYFGFPQYEIGSLINRGRASYTDLCRLGYRLGFELAAMPPRITDAMRAEAEELARYHGIVAGRSLVLFPYARSVRQDSFAHMTALAEIAKQAGYHVVTSISGDERPIPGTPGAFIRFDLLIPFCELAGTVLAIKSGIGDILASARCHKLLVYANQGDIDMFSVIEAELGGNSAEITFDFNRGSVEEFLSYFDRLHTPLYADLHNAVPLPVQRYLAAHRGDAQAEMTLETPSYVQVFGKYRGVGGLVLGNGWSGLEGWGAWTVGARAFVYLTNIYAELTNEDGSPPDLVLRLDLTAALNQNHLEHHIRVTLGELERAYAFVAGQPLPLVELPIPAAMTRERYLKIIFDISTPHPPSVHPTDPRPLGVGLVRAQIRTIVAEGPPAERAAASDPSVP